MLGALAACEYVKQHEHQAMQQKEEGDIFLFLPVLSQAIA